MNELDALCQIAQQTETAKQIEQQVLLASLEEQEKEYIQMKQAYPSQLFAITEKIEDLCDQLEYEGSPMFHEVLDAPMIWKLAQNVYQDVTDAQEDAAVSCMAWRPDPKHDGCRDGHCEPPYVPDCDHGNCMLRQMIEVLLLNEMHHRRNRYRCRHCR